MKTRQSTYDIDKLAKDAVEILASSDDARYLHKVAIVHLALNENISINDLAEGIGVTRQTISNWLKIASAKGFDALRDKSKIGRPTKITEEIASDIDGILQENNPQKYGYSIWDGPTLSKYLKEVYSLDYSVRSCQRLARDLGYTLLRPQPFPTKDEELNDEAAREQFKAEMRDIIDDPNAVLVFQDEVHFYAQTTISRRWARKGSKPKVPSKVGKDSAGYSGFVVHGTGQLYIYEPGRFTFETTIHSIRAFLLDIKLEAGQTLYLVMDNAPWHKKAKRLIEEDPQYLDIREKVRFVSLPPYSPDLNPIEQVWRITRRECTHNRYFKTLLALKEALSNYWKPFQLPNDKLKTLCSFKFKCREPKPEKQHERKHYTNSEAARKAS